MSPTDPLPSLLAHSLPALGPHSHVGERWRGGRRFDARSESSGRVRVAPVRMGPSSVRTRARRERKSPPSPPAGRPLNTPLQCSVGGYRPPPEASREPVAASVVRNPSRPTPHAYQSRSVAYQVPDFHKSVFSLPPTGPVGGLLSTRGPPRGAPGVFDNMRAVGTRDLGTRSERGQTMRSEQTQPPCATEPVGVICGWEGCPFPNSRSRGRTTATTRGWTTTLPRRWSAN